MATKPKKVRVMISMDERVLQAMEMYIQKLQEAKVSQIDTKSKLIEEAILTYFNLLSFNFQEKLTKGGKKHES